MTLYEFSNYCSIGGGFIVGTLIYAFFIERKISYLKKDVLFNTRVESLVDDLHESSNKLPNLLSDFQSNGNQIKTTLGECSAHLESIIPKLPNSDAKEYNELLTKLKTIIKTEFAKNGDEPSKWYEIWENYKYTNQDIWNILTDLYICVNRLKNLQKDKNII